jgi:hypothetical protein
LTLESPVSSGTARLTRPFSIPAIRLGIRQPALEGDEGRIVDRSHREIKDYGGVGPRGRHQREPGKRRHRGGNADVGAKASGD